MIDTATQELYSMSIPPSEKTFFSIKAYADAERKGYVSHKIKVLSARSRMERTRLKKKEKSSLISLMISLAPITLLIIV